MDDAQPSRAPLRDALRVLAQEITALGADPLPPLLLEEIAGVTLLHAAGIVNTVRVPLVVLDATLHVRMANRYFYECFQVTPQETESHRFYDLGNGQWNIPPCGPCWSRLCPTTRSSTTSRSRTRFLTWAPRPCSSMPAKSSARTGRLP